MTNERLIEIIIEEILRLQGADGLVTESQPTRLEERVEHTVRDAVNVESRAKAQGGVTGAERHEEREGDSALADRRTEQQSPPASDVTQFGHAQEAADKTSEHSASMPFISAASSVPVGKAATQAPVIDLAKLRASTSARIGIGNAGPRMKTETLLHFRADHAAARDAVWRDVSEEVIESLNLFSVQTRCKDLNEFLTRPDHGRLLDKESEERVKKMCTPSPDVQIFVADGLSSAAIEANAENILPAIMDSLEAKGLKVGTPFFVKYGRVGSEDHISELLDAKVVCVLIGERPGLMTAESMSAYIAYRATVNMPESRRTVVSNIHKGGTPAPEAGAFIADIIEQILQAGKSGVEFKR